VGGWASGLVSERAHPSYGGGASGPERVALETRAEIGPVPRRDRSAQLPDVEIDILTRIGWHYVRSDPRAQLSRGRSQRMRASQERTLPSD